MLKKDVKKDTTKSELKDAAGVDTSNLATKKTLLL